MPFFFNPTTGQTEFIPEQIGPFATPGSVPLAQSPVTGTGQSLAAAGVAPTVSTSPVDARRAANRQAATSGAASATGLAGGSPVGAGVAGGLALLGLIGSLGGRRRQRSSFQRLIDENIARQRTGLARRGLRGISPVIPTELLLAQEQAERRRRAQLLQSLAQLGLVAGSVAQPQLAPLLGLASLGVSRA